MGAPHARARVRQRVVGPKISQDIGHPSTRAFLSNMNTSNSSLAFFSTRQLAERWQCSRMHVNRLISSGRLRAENRGNGKCRPYWRVRREDLEKYERQGCTG